MKRLEVDVRFSFDLEKIRNEYVDDAHMEEFDVKTTEEMIDLTMKDIEDGMSADIDDGILLITLLSGREVNG